MPARLVAIVAAAGIAVAGFFLVRSLDDDLVYYLFVDEAVDQRDEFADGRAFRLAGIVVPGSIVDQGGGVSEFSVTDGGATVDVRLTRTPPPLFDDDVPVLLAGAWEGDTFVATDALIRHDEGYEAPSTGNFPGEQAAG
jgi:cytochrome c-type biogenesis protein CcmE